MQGWKYGKGLVYLKFLTDNQNVSKNLMKLAKYSREKYFDPPKIVFCFVP